jgi:hypothetical protein
MKEGRKERNTELQECKDGRGQCEEQDEQRVQVVSLQDPCK